MAFTAIVTEGFKVAGESFIDSNEFSEGGLQGVDEAIAASQTDSEIAFVLDVDQCVAFYMVCDQDIIIETNNGAAPVDTINLVAGVPYLWYTTNYDSFLLGTDVTALFATTGAIAAAANLKVRAVYDPTP